MRTEERLRALKQWLYENLCKGRQMKAPAYSEDGYTLDITKIKTQEPIISLAWEPSRPGAGWIQGIEPNSVVPGILIMPNQSFAKHVEEKRFDRYNNIRRNPEMAQELNVDILFKVFEPGIRLPGFVESADSPSGLDMTLLKEGTEEGLFTLTNWMDDCIDLFISQKSVPHTDMFIEESTCVYSLYMDENYVVDKRPIYYGFIKAKFYGYSERTNNNAIEEFLR